LRQGPSKVDNVYKTFPFLIHPGNEHSTALDSYSASPSLGLCTCVKSCTLAAALTCLQSFAQGTAACGSITASWAGPRVAQRYSLTCISLRVSGSILAYLSLFLFLTGMLVMLLLLVSGRPAKSVKPMQIAQCIGNPCCMCGSHIQPVRIKRCIGNPHCTCRLHIQPAPTTQCGSRSASGILVARADHTSSLCRLRIAGQIAHRQSLLHMQITHPGCADHTVHRQFLLHMQITHPACADPTEQITKCISSACYTRAATCVWLVRLVCKPCYMWCRESHGMCGRQSHCV